ncbi:DUF4923 family protein [Bacteroides sp. 519]|uniref:DUF4923 family protein n=1 Tax=Bacteroides sp. 519 TaxID=2302937 RepID=UPI0013D52353|nr:DUF4923 family protein [Bacteroides sp. 519]NDV60182.1 DUF4923 family protein [Bacteroides sp. 519]
MKRYQLIVLIACSLLLVTDAQAQSLKDLLDKVTNSTETTQSNNTTIVGEWTYTGSAIEFKSDNLLKKAGGAIAATQLKTKLDEQLASFGVKSGLAGFTFNANNIFAGTVNNRPFRGTYSYNSETKSASFIFAGFFTLDAQVKNANNKMTVLFDADKLLLLLNYFSQQSNNATLKAIATLANSYEGMMVGLELKKK